jgi:hypothetical protein
VNILHKKKIVLLGMMTKIPVAGAVWGTMHYLLGLRRLGYEPYYVEAHARTPSMFMETEADDGSARASAFLDAVMRRFDLQHNWAFHALHEENGRCYGMSEHQLQELYRSAALLINYHGGTMPLPEHYATGRLVYLETDPVELEIELHENRADTIAFLEPHCALFTWGLNYGRADCKVPLPERFRFYPSPPAVVVDLWEGASANGRPLFTTIGNWKQNWREVTFQGEVYTWSKHHEFMKILELPRRTAQRFELALSSYDEADCAMLESKGWRVRPAMGFSRDLEAYRQYILDSRGEFTVAKDQNVRLRSGWFSERSAQYLAAGRPVITQETGFGNVLPTGQGLFGFSNMEEIVGAVDVINTDYPRHCRAAREIAREIFDTDVVLKEMLGQVGINPTA